MNEVLQTNLFFVITSIAVLALTALVSIALIYLIRILRNINDITERLRRGSEKLAEDASAMRSFVHEGVVGNVLSFFSRFVKGKSASRKTRKKDSDDDLS
jgi:hypothetical protein